MNIFCLFYPHIDAKEQVQSKRCQIQKRETLYSVIHGFALEKDETASISTTGSHVSAQITLQEFKLPEQAHSPRLSAFDVTRQN